MLNLFQSNQTRRLAAIFCERASSQQDPMKPLQLVVQSFGMGQWLKLQLAEKQGISANVNAQLPAAFLWQLYRDLIPQAASLETSPFANELMAFRIMRLLKGGLRLAPAVAGYLEQPDDGDLRRYQLANEIAGLLDQYMMFRPEMILNWEGQQASGKAGAAGAAEGAGANGSNGDPHNAGLLDYHADWQCKLWLALLADMPPEHRQLHRASLHQQLIAAFKSCVVKPEQLPGQLSIFGLATLPPLQLQTFEAMGQLTEVDLYFLNPCEHYWADIISPRDKAKRSIRQLLGKEEALIDEDYLEIGNPILSSLGKQGREFFEMLQDYGQLASDEQEFFAPFEEDSALNIVKNDILNLTYAGEFPQPGELPPKINLPECQSLQIHNCYSRLREVEVLHDQLLHIISDNPDIALADIIVMVPDIAQYAPLIQTVFGDTLHYRLNDRSQAAGSPLLASFLQLLDLPQARITGTELLDLLESQAVKRKLGLEQADLDLLATWIKGTNIRWELDGAAKQERWQVPDESHHTWRFGLDRLLLGFARSPESGSWQEMLGYDIKPTDAELLGKLASLIDRLAEYRTDYGRPRPVAEWVSLMTTLLADFFDPDLEEIPDHAMISRTLEQLANQALDAGMTDEISFYLMHHLLKGALTEQRPARGFLAGGITFATLVPMRSIPFKVICLLGMNDGDYPRDKRPHSYDLLHLDGHRKGDRSRKLDDRYLFLEALLSAERVFYVSYLGMGVRDNKEKPPSVVLGEWQAYLESVFDGYQVTQHPLQPFSRKHYAGGTLQSFSEVWEAQLPSATPPLKFVDGKLSEDDALVLTSLMQLEGFFRHSGRYFLQQRLGVWLDEDEAKLPDTEPFQLDGLERYQLADDALAALMAGLNLDEWQADMLASGSVMAGRAGRQQLQREIERAQAVHEAIGEVTGGKEAEVLTGVVRLGASDGPKSSGSDHDANARDASIAYSLPQFYRDDAGGKLLDYRVGKLQDRHLLVAWIRHLVACADADQIFAQVNGAVVSKADASIASKGITTVCIAENYQKEPLVIPPLLANEAVAELRYLADIYAAGVNCPLFLPPATGRAFAEAYFNSDKKQAGLKNREAILKSALEIGGEDARRQYEGGFMQTGETDRYWQRLFASPDDFNVKFAGYNMAIWGPLLRAIKPKDD